MKKQSWYIIGLAFAGYLLLMAQRWLTLAARAVELFEDFSASPYWDVSRWSWGYGTAAPGSSGTISRARALADAKKVLTRDYGYLAPMISRKLTVNQWAALLSFSYNLGPGNADNLVPNINSGNDAALETQWKKYVYAGGKINSVLVDRRNKEWRLWSENIL
jgi:lysozyme